MSTTVDTAALAEARAIAQEAAAKAAAKAADAQAKLDAAEAAIEAERQRRYLAWCEHVVAHRREREQAAVQRIYDTRQAFTAAVAEGDLGAALQRFLEWGEAAGEQAGLQRTLSHALSQIDPDAPQPELSYRHQPGAFVEELSKAVAQAAANRNADVEDAVQEEIYAAMRGEVVLDGD